MKRRDDWGEEWAFGGEPASVGYGTISLTSAAGNGESSACRTA